MKPIQIVICVLMLANLSFIGVQTFRIADSLEYSKQQVEKFEPVIDIAAGIVNEKAELLNALRHQQ